MSRHFLSALAAVAATLAVIATGPARAEDPPKGVEIPADYLIGPGDTLQIFVWDHPDLTSPVQVRPDGRISTPLVEDLQAAGKSPTALARDVEKMLSEYVRS